MRATLITALLLALASTPASAQFANQDNWGRSYQDNGNRGQDVDRTLCEVERVARIVGNVANALRDRGYGGNYGGYGCQSYRINYQQHYQERYVPQYRDTYPPYQPQYQNGGLPYNYQPPQTFNFNYPPQGNRVCVLTPGGFQICP